MSKKTPTPTKPKPDGYVFGRPTKYLPEYCEQIVDYFRQPVYSTVTDADGNVTRVKNLFPTLTRFADKIGVNDDTLVEWAKVHPNFSAALKAAKKLQEANLQEGALDGAYHGTFAIFTAKNVCGWRDEKDLKLGNIPGENFRTDNTVTVTGLADVIQKAKAKR